MVESTMDIFDVYDIDSQKRKADHIENNGAAEETNNIDHNIIDHIMSSAKKFKEDAPNADVNIENNASNVNGVAEFTQDLKQFVPRLTIDEAETNTSSLNDVALPTDLECVPLRDLSESANCKSSREENDFRTKQMHLQCQELLKRARRMQIQHTHRNITKNMKLFISCQQKLNSINCQRFDFDFCNFINFPSDNTSQLKSYLLQQKDVTFLNSDKLCQSDQNSTTFFPPSFTNQPSRSNGGNLNNSSFDALRQKCNKSHLSNQPQTSSQSCLLTKKDHISTNNNLLNDLPFSTSTFPSDVQASATSLNQNRPTLTSHKTLSPESKEKILSTIDSLRFNLRHLESKYDSDATDSSSGGESCDELEENDFSLSTYPLSQASSSSSFSFLHSNKRPNAVRNQSSWRYCTDRSAIASHWSWIEAHISDCETKLRQQNDIYRHLRATKGSIIFGNDRNEKRQFPSSSSISSTHVNLNNSNQSLSASVSSSLSQPGNNDNPNLSENGGQNIQMSNNELQVVPLQEEPAEESACMRTIPYVSMKRRKLVRSESTLSIAAKKTVKYSSIQCSCNIFPSYVPPCVICNGRYNYMHSIDTEFMPYNERISLLDSSCHPFLCLPNNVPLGIYFMQLLKRENILNIKPVSISRNKKKKITNASRPSTSPSDLNQKSKKLILSNCITKSKKKLTDKSKKRRLSTDSLKKPLNRERFSSGCSSLAESPVPSPSLSEGSSNGASNLTPLQTPTTPSAPLRRRRSEQHAFDIDNIVIPYSIAAATRVERLQYKEIITPKWRVNEEFAIPPPENIKQQIVNNNKETNHDEDISQNAFETRHSKCEENERQRILSYYVGLNKNQNPRKGTSRVRFESKSDSVDHLIHETSNSKGKSKTQTDYGCERKRHSSISKLFIPKCEESLEEELKPVVAPFELRQFPLPNYLYDMMLQESKMQEIVEEVPILRSDSVTKNSTDHMNSLDHYPHASNGLVASPAITDVEMNDEDLVKDHFYRDDLLSGEKDDPEWKPE